VSRKREAVCVLEREREREREREIGCWNEKERNCVTAATYLLNEAMIFFPFLKRRYETCYHESSLLCRKKMAILLHVRFVLYTCMCVEDESGAGSGNYLSATIIRTTNHFFPCRSFVCCLYKMEYILVISLAREEGSAQ
jgi:hypothetical protein